ncbi:MAG: hypothetical protein Q4B23_02160 [Helcococcus sp.]|nr:hypothetical protein [Helcococcus sp.]
MPVEMETTLWKKLNDLKKEDKKLLINELLEEIKQINKKLDQIKFLLESKG